MPPATHVTERTRPWWTLVGATRTIAVFGVGVVCLAAFWVIEHRVQYPIVEFSLFRNRPYFGATAAGFAIVFAYWTVMFYQPSTSRTSSPTRRPPRGC